MMRKKIVEKEAADKEKCLDINKKMKRLDLEEQAEGLNNILEKDVISRINREG